MLSSHFIELASDLSPEWIIMEEIPVARGLAAGGVALLRDRGYAAERAVLSAEKYDVPQRCQILVMVARKVEEPPANFPPTTTHDLPLSSGEALIKGMRRERGQSDRVITCQVLEKVRMRPGMAKERVGAIG